MISQATPTVMIGDRKIMLIAVLAARIFGLESRERGRGIVDRFREMDYLLSICRSARAACAGSLSNWATAASMSWAVALLGAATRGAAVLRAARGTGRRRLAWLGMSLLATEGFAFLLGGFALSSLMSDVKRVAGVVAWDGQLPAVLLEVSRIFLAQFVVHKRLLQLLLLTHRCSELPSRT